MKTITATRTTTNPAWTQTITIKLVSTSNGYWWQGVAPEGATSKDAVIDAHALRPGQNRRTGYATVDAACRQAIKEGWQVIRD